MLKVPRLIENALSCQRRLASSLVFALVFLCGLQAGAQTTASSFAVTGLSPNTISSGNCNGSTPLGFNVTATVDFNAVGQVVYLRVYATSATVSQTCPTQPPVADPVVGSSTYTSTNTTSQTFTVPAQDDSVSLTNFGDPTTAALGVCGGTVPDRFALCAYASAGPAFTQILTNGYSTPAVFSSVNTTPGQILIDKAAAGDTEIFFDVTTNKNEGFTACYVSNDSGPADGSSLPEAGSNGDCTGLTGTVSGTVNGSSTASATGKVKLTGLKNTVSYAFVVKGSEGGVWSNVLGPVTPVPKLSTLELYQGSDGGISWECAQNDAPLSISSIATLLILFAVGYFLSPSRRRRSARLMGKTLVVLFLGFAATPSHADIGQWNLGLGATFYRPAFDKGTTYPVYKCLYGDAIVPKLGIDADWHVFDPFGSFQVGFELAFTWANGTAADQNQAGQTTCAATTTNSPTSVNMNLLMFNPRIRYVFDEFVEDFYIVPFVEGGINMTGYYFTYRGSADIKGQANGHDPLGIRFGWHAGGGFLFLLDWIEPQVAASARANGTYEHVYLKTQVSYVQVNDFGSPGYDFSPAQFGADIPLQLDFAIVFEF